MKRTRFVALTTLLTMLLTALGAGSAFAQSSVDSATADLRDAQGNPVGTAEFTQGEDGVVVTVSVQGGVEPGVHGIHIHETGAVTPSFEAAGGHFNPTDNNHGFESPNGPHAGDLLNITVGEDGTASYQTVNDRVTLSGGENSLLDADGSALIIHSMPDDYMTDPGGNSGERVAGGVIQATATATSMPETGGISLLPLAALLTLSGAGLLLWRVRRA